MSSAPVSLKPTLDRAMQRVIELEQILSAQITELKQLEDAYLASNGPAGFYNSFAMAHSLHAAAAAAASTTIGDDALSSPAGAILASALQKENPTQKAVTFSPVEDTGSFKIATSAVDGPYAAAASFSSSAPLLGGNYRNAPFVKLRRNATLTTVRLVRALTRTILLYFGCQAQGEMAVLPFNMDPTEMRHRIKILQSSVFRVVKLRLRPREGTTDEAERQKWDDEAARAESIEAWRDGGASAPAAASANAAAAASSFAGGLGRTGLRGSSRLTMMVAPPNSKTRLFDDFEIAEREKADAKLRHAELLARLAILNVRNSPWYNPRHEVALQKKVMAAERNDANPDGEDGIDNNDEGDGSAPSSSLGQQQRRTSVNNTTGMMTMIPVRPHSSGGGGGSSNKPHPHLLIRPPSSTLAAGVAPNSFGGLAPLQVNLSIDAVWAEVYRAKELQSKLRASGNASIYLASGTGGGGGGGGARGSALRGRSPSIMSSCSAGMNSDWSGEPIPRPCRSPHRHQEHAEELNEKRRHVLEVRSWRSSRSSTASSAIRPYLLLRRRCWDDSGGGGTRKGTTAEEEESASYAQRRMMSGVRQPSTPRAYTGFPSYSEKVAAREKREKSRGLWQEHGGSKEQDRQQRQKRDDTQIPYLPPLDRKSKQHHQQQPQIYQPPKLHMADFAPPIIRDNPSVAAAVKKRREREQHQLLHLQQQSPPKKPSTAAVGAPTTANSAARPSLTATSVVPAIALPIPRIVLPPKKPAAAAPKRGAGDTKRPQPRTASPLSLSTKKNRSGSTSSNSRKPSPKRKQSLSASSSRGRSPGSSSVKDDKRQQGKKPATAGGGGSGGDAGGEAPAAASPPGSPKRNKDGLSAAAILAQVNSGSSRFRLVKYKRRHHDAVTIIASWWRNILVCSAARADMLKMRVRLLAVATTLQQFGRAYQVRKRLDRNKQHVLVIQRSAQAWLASAVRARLQHGTDVVTAYGGWKRQVARCVKRFLALRELRRRQRLQHEYTEHRLTVEESDSDTLLITMQWRYDALLHRLCVAWGLEQLYFRAGANKGGTSLFAGKNNAGSGKNLKRVGSGVAAASSASPSNSSSTSPGSPSVAILPRQRVMSLSGVGANNSGIFGRSMISGQAGGDSRRTSGGSNSAGGGAGDDGDDEGGGDNDSLSPSMRLAALDLVMRARSSAQVIKKRRERFATRIQKVWRGHRVRRTVVAPLRECMEYLRLFRDAARMRILTEDKLAIRSEEEEKRWHLQNRLQRANSGIGCGGSSNNLLAAKLKGMGGSGSGAGFAAPHPFHPMTHARVVPSSTLANLGDIFPATIESSFAYFPADNLTPSQSAGNYDAGGGACAGNDSASSPLFEPTRLQYQLRAQHRKDTLDPVWRDQYHKFLARETRFFAEHQRLPVVSKMGID